MFRGAIVLVPFPFTDLSGNKVRPCVVLYEQKGGDDCVVSFISSIQKAKLETFDLRIKATKLNGLKKDSVIKVNKIATLQKKIALGELGAVDPTLLLGIDTRLKKMLQLT